MDTPNYSSFENIVISISVSGRTLLLASIYHPPGHCSSSFLDEFIALQSHSDVNLNVLGKKIPDGFKKAVVTPLIKKALFPVEDLKNYCPVSGLNFISKLVEHVVAKQLVDHIHQQGLDNSYQSAYKSGHSMETALLSIKNYIHLSLSWGEATAWYFWISRPPLILLIIPLSSAVFCISSVLVAPLSNGSLPI